MRKDESVVRERATPPRRQKPSHGHFNPESEVDRRHSSPSFGGQGLPALGAASLDADRIGTVSPSAPKHGTDCLALNFGFRVQRSKFISHRSSIHPDFPANRHRSILFNCSGLCHRRPAGGLRPINWRDAQYCPLRTRFNEWRSVLRARPGRSCYDSDRCLKANSP